VYEELYLKEYNQFRELARLFYSCNLGVSSYFWEARRLLGDSNGFSPRQAFIRAVAGQPPRGYERAVLDRGQAPPDFVASVGAVEADRARRQMLMTSLNTGEGIWDARLERAVPRLAEGVRVERKPVIGEGEFVWGQVVTTPGHPEGTPVSALIARMVSLIDGKSSVGDLLAALSHGLDQDQGNKMRASAVAALRILYVEGAVDEFAGL